MKKKKLVVLDYMSKEVSIYEYDENIYDCPEDFEIDGVFVIHSNCYFMVVDELKINVI